MSSLSAPSVSARLILVLPLLALLALSHLACGRPMGGDPDREPTPGADTPSTAKAPSRPVAAPAAPLGPAATEEWNPTQIEWQPFDAASSRAKAENKPVCVIFSAGWCPHCKNYSHVFDDPRVAARAKDFEMVHVDVDAEPALAARFATDGGYVPRTYFIGPDGTLATEIHAARPRYQYFYDEKDPTALLAGMEASLRKLGR
jgi:thiol-disulfide isomerase/thioredoxin